MAPVVDTSAILALAYDDEDAAYAEAVIARIATEGAVVPTMFWFELRNALVMGERRGRITAEQTRAFLADLALLPFEVDDEPDEAGVMELARRFRLTVYDAAYLEVARRRRLALATIDEAIVRAAQGAGVEVLRV